MKPVLYLIGSLRNPDIPKIEMRLGALGYDVFAEWYSAGRIADDCWKEHQIARGLTYPEALKGYAARHIFEFDYYHLNRADLGVLVQPAGKSGHLELGYLIGRGKPGYVLLEKDLPRWDVMLCFARSVHETLDDLVTTLKGAL